jgi:hypothetical protein
MKKIYMTLAVMLTALYGHAATPDHLYIIGNEPLGAGWNPATGNECHRTSDGKFTYSLTTDGDAPGQIYFGFTTTLADNPENEDWDTMNEGRFSPAANNTEFSFGQKVEMLKVSDNPDLKDNSWKVTLEANTTYDLTIDINAMQFTMTRNGEQGGDDPVITGLQPTGTLPVIYINVYKADDLGNATAELDNYVLSKDLGDKKYRPGTYYMTVPEGSEFKSIGSAEEQLPLEIKARGNYTRTAFAKKPFKLKLGKKQNMLGLTPDKSKHYAILAHADDQFGYLRNFTGFNLGKRIQLPWTPGMTPVEIVINGDYRGLYFLTESIRVGDGRIQITELDDNVEDGKLLSGGYLVELDNYKDDPNTIVLNDDENVDDQLYVTPDTPEEYSDLQKRFITEQFNTMHSLVKSHNDNLWGYMELDDAARYYIVEELIGHTESYHGSTYLFRDFGENQKWHFSPLWDCGNAFMAYEEMHFFDCDPFGNTWITDIVRNDRFEAKVKETWKWFMQNNFDGLFDDIDTYVNSLKNAAVADHKRWGDAPLPDSPSATQVVNNSNMDEKRNNVRDYLNRRIEWLKEQWGDYSGSYSEPERDNTPAAALPDYVMPDYSSIEIIGTPSTPECAAPIYYDLTGRKLNSPETGSIVIVRRGDKVSKEIAR